MSRFKAYQFFNSSLPARFYIRQSFLHSKPFQIHPQYPQDMSQMSFAKGYRSSSEESTETTAWIGFQWTHLCSVYSAHRVLSGCADFQKFESTNRWGTTLTKMKTKYPYTEVLDQPLAGWLPTLSRVSPTVSSWSARLFLASIREIPKEKLPRQIILGQN